MTHEISLNVCRFREVVRRAQVIGREELCDRLAFCPELQLVTTAGKISSKLKIIFGQPLYTAR
jgi:hypothetical protein